MTVDLRHLAGRLLFGLASSAAFALPVQASGEEGGNSPDSSGCAIVARLSIDFSRVREEDLKMAPPCAGGSADFFHVLASMLLNLAGPLGPSGIKPFDFAGFYANAPRPNPREALYEAWLRHDADARREFERLRAAQRPELARLLRGLLREAKLGIFITKNRAGAIGWAALIECPGRDAGSELGRILDCFGVKLNPSAVKGMHSFEIKGSIRWVSSSPPHSERGIRHTDEIFAGGLVLRALLKPAAAVISDGPVAAALAVEHLLHASAGTENPANPAGSGETVRAPVSFFVDPGLALECHESSLDWHSGMELDRIDALFGLYSLTGISCARWDPASGKSSCSISAGGNPVVSIMNPQAGKMSAHRCIPPDCAVGMALRVVDAHAAWRNLISHASAIEGRLGRNDTAKLVAGMEDDIGTPAAEVAAMIAGEVGFFIRPETEGAPFGFGIFAKLKDPGTFGVLCRNAEAGGFARRAIAYGGKTSRIKAGSREILAIGWNDAAHDPKSGTGAGDRPRGLYLALLGDVAVFASQLGSILAAARAYDESADSGSGSCSLKVVSNPESLLRIVFRDMILDHPGGLAPVKLEGSAGADGIEAHGCDFAARFFTSFVRALDGMLRYETAAMLESDRFNVIACEFARYASLKAAMPASLGEMARDNGYRSAPWWLFHCLDPRAGSLAGSGIDEAIACSTLSYNPPDFRSGASWRHHPCLFDRSMLLPRCHMVLYVMKNRGLAFYANRVESLDFLSSQGKRRK